jgi:hypothetical protein
VEIVQIEQPTAIYTLGSARSISAQSDWLSSFRWARCWRNEWDRRSYADFLAAQVLRYALQAHDAAGVRKVVLEICAQRTVPSSGSVASGLTGLVPRSWAERAAVLLGTLASRRHTDDM